MYFDCCYVAVFAIRFQTIDGVQKLQGVWELQWGRCLRREWKSDVDWCLASVTCYYLNRQ
jgi:hypothetical protein